MNKAIALFLILAGLISFVSAADIVVNVGTKDGKNLFEPDTVNAAMGDNVCTTIFTLCYLICQRSFLFTKTSYFNHL